MVEARLTFLANAAVAVNVPNTPINATRTIAEYCFLLTLNIEFLNSGTVDKRRIWAMIDVQSVLLQKPLISTAFLKKIEETTRANIQDKAISVFLEKNDC